MSRRNPFNRVENGHDRLRGLRLQDEWNDVAGRRKSGAIRNVFLEHFKVTDLPLRN